MTSTILTGDALEMLKTIESGTVNTCVTSPPYYGLRQYLPDGSDLKSFEIGLEQTPEQYISNLVEVFREVRRVLRDDGTCWVNIGDSYAGSGGAGNQFGQLEKDGFNAYKQKELPIQCKPKDLIGIPWMLAFALRADGWYLRQDIIWAKPNPMPESVRDRCTKSHEYIFLLSKSKQYYYDSEAISEPITDTSMLRYLQDIENQTGSDRVPGKTNGNMKAVMPKFGGSKYGDDDDPKYRTKSGKEWKPTMGGGGTSFIGHKGNFKADGTPISGATRNKRSVWTVCVNGFKEAHFATFPQALIEPCILAGAPFDGFVLDPFTGSGTTAVTALQNGRNFIGVELNPKYVTMAEKRIKKQGHYQERIGLEG